MSESTPKWHWLKNCEGDPCGLANGPNEVLLAQNYCGLSWIDIADKHAEQIVRALNTHDELLAACKAWVSFYHGNIVVPEGEPADDAVVSAFDAAERKIVDAMTAAIAAAEGGE